MEQTAKLLRACQPDPICTHPHSARPHLLPMPLHSLHSPKGCLATACSKATLHLKLLHRLFPLPGMLFPQGPAGLSALHALNPLLSITSSGRLYKIAAPFTLYPSFLASFSSRALFTIKYVSTHLYYYGWLSP